MGCGFSQSGGDDFIGFLHHKKNVHFLKDGNTWFSPGIVFFRRIANGSFRSSNPSEENWMKRFLEPRGLRKVCDGFLRHIGSHLSLLVAQDLDKLRNLEVSHRFSNLKKFVGAIWMSGWSKQL